MQFVYGQTDEKLIARRISEIRFKVGLINRSVKSLSKTTVDVDDSSLEGTQATYYRTNRELLKVSANMYGETNRATVELYYASGKLIFAFIKRGRYDTQIGVQPAPKILSSEEQRFYFAVNGRLIRLVVGTGELKPGAERYTDLKDQVFSIASKLGRLTIAQ